MAKFPVKVQSIRIESTDFLSVFGNLAYILQRRSMLTLYDVSIKMSRKTTQKKRGAPWTIYYQGSFHQKPGLNY